jgi:hypothetical protein
MVKTLQAEIAGLQSVLGEGERSRQQREAAINELQAQIALLSGDLDASREVGKAVLAALQTLPAILTQPLHAN